jgi:hypothetical protein
MEGDASPVKVLVQQKGVDGMNKDEANETGSEAKRGTGLSRNVCETKQVESSLVRTGGEPLLYQILPTLDL